MRSRIRHSAFSYQCRRVSLGKNRHDWEPDEMLNHAFEKPCSFYVDVSMWLFSSSEIPVWWWMRNFPLPLPPRASIENQNSDYALHHAGLYKEVNLGGRRGNSQNIPTQRDWHRDEKLCMDNSKELYLPVESKFLPAENNSVSESLMSRCVQEHNWQYLKISHKLCL